MTAPQCRHEQDVINAVVVGHWPDRVDASLQSHASHCDVCRELVEVAGLMRIDREALQTDVNVPSAGQVWWRAAIRTRLEASHQAARPLSWLFGVAVACAAGLAIAVVEILWSQMRQAAPGDAVSWTTMLGFGEIGRLLPTLAGLTPLSATGAFILLGTAACLLLAPLALYFALSDE